MSVIKLEVEVDVRNELVPDVDVFALNFVGDALNTGMKNSTAVRAYTARLIAPGEAEKLEEWKVLIAVPWHLRTPEQQAKIDELALWFSSEERTTHIGAITQGEKS